MNHMNKEDKRFELQYIGEFIADEYGISEEEFVKRGCGGVCKEARKMFTYLCHYHPSIEFSYSEIGQHLGRLDHTTVIKYLKDIDDEIAKNKELENKVHKMYHNCFSNGKKHGHFYGEYQISYQVSGDEIKLKLPEKIRKNLKEKGTLVLIGVGDHLEAYSLDAWKRVCEDTDVFNIENLMDIWQNL